MTFWDLFCVVIIIGSVAGGISTIMIVYGMIWANHKDRR